MYVCVCRCWSVCAHGKTFGRPFFFIVYDIHVVRRRPSHLFLLFVLYHSYFCLFSFFFLCPVSTFFLFSDSSFSKHSQLKLKIKQEQQQDEQKKIFFSVYFIVIITIALLLAKLQTHWEQAAIHALRANISFYLKTKTGNNNIDKVCCKREIKLIIYNVFPHSFHVYFSLLDVLCTTLLFTIFSAVAPQQYQIIILYCTIFSIFNFDGCFIFWKKKKFACDWESKRCAGCCSFWMN